jgi:DNA topoisomerase VI, subunit A
MNTTVEKLGKIVEEIYDQLEEGEIPGINVTTRSKSNIKFNQEFNVWKYGQKYGTRSAKTLDGAYMLLRTVSTIDFIKEMIETSKSSTLREMYYISEGWKRSEFHSQDESNRLIEDLEIMTRMLREEFKLRPEENGASVIGNVTVEEKVRTGGTRKINCRDDVGDAGYTIPYSVENDKINFKGVDADFIIAIETGGMFDRLAENRFDEKARAVLVHLKGQPARSTRRLLKRMNEELKLPVVVFTDGDPWSFRIYSSIAYGAIKTAHISEYLATPSAQFVGVTPSDIVNYDLPTDGLSDRDVDALKSELSDPRFNNEFWKGEIKLQLNINKKAEQQALAKYGLEYATSAYLPEKLAGLGILKR